MPDGPLATVGALIVGPGDTLLLIKTHKWRGRWGVPGGKIHYGETMKAALEREFMEETGLELFDIRWGPVQEAVKSPEFYREAHFILLNFIARSRSERVVLNEEAQAFAWVTADEALGYKLNRPTRRLIAFYQAVGFGGAPL